MKNFKINPSVKTFDLKVTVTIQQLETEGWDFEDWHRNKAESENIPLDAAKAENYREYVTEIQLLSCEDGSIGTLYGWNNDQIGEKTETGDDEQTLGDIITFLNEGTLVIDDSKDFSTNGNGDYVPTFINLAE